MLQKGPCTEGIFVLISEEDVAFGQRECRFWQFYSNLCH